MQFWDGGVVCMFLKANVAKNIECDIQACSIFWIYRSARFRHYILYFKDEPVSVLTLQVDGPLASFWNGATLPNFRRKGFSTILRAHALNEAKKEECKYIISYLMEKAMAKGVCEKLGLKTAWVFYPYIKEFKSVS